METTVNKSMVSKAVINKVISDKKPKEIKAKHIMGYESPNKVLLKGKEESYIPDLAITYDSQTVVYEIELTDSNAVNKWRILSLYAKKNNGSLYLVVPDYLKDTIKQEISDNEINAGLIVFNTNMK